VTERIERVRAAAGTWRYERDRVRLEPRRRLTKTERAQLESESTRLADFLCG
jgi:hypothetical protein